MWATWLGGNGLLSTKGLRETIAGQVDLEAAGINPQVLDSLVLEDGPVAEYLDVIAATVKETMEATGKSRSVVAAPLIREAAAYLTEKMPDYAQDGGEALRRDLLQRGLVDSSPQTGIVPVSRQGF